MYFFSLLFISANWVLKALFCFCSRGVKSGVMYTFWISSGLSLAQSFVQLRKSIAFSRSELTVTSISLGLCWSSFLRPILLALVTSTLTPTYLSNIDLTLLMSYDFLSDPLSATILECCALLHSGAFYFSPSLH